jgi:RecA-family ATPase
MARDLGCQDTSPGGASGRTAPCCARAPPKANDHEAAPLVVRKNIPLPDTAQGAPVTLTMKLPEHANGKIGDAGRDSLLLSAWLKKEIPPRDFLLGSVMCTTSRWLIYGETGVVKTLVAMDMAGAIASGRDILNWVGQRPARVIFLDGELPVETFKERMEMVAARYGANMQLFGYNREDLGFDAMPPLNTEAGQTWLRREIAAVRPDLIIFHSIMSLLIGSMAEEESWAPMKPLVRELSGRGLNPPQRISEGIWPAC